MQAEQPLITICEICSGAHPTSAHTDTKESSQEKEPNHEAMEKVVDIFATEDLKYRSYDHIITSLETGIPTPTTNFLYQPFGRLDENTRKEMKHAIKELGQIRQKDGEGEELQQSRSKQQANVFYPEGLLKALHDQVLGTKNVELWSKNELKNFEDHAHKPTIVFIIKQLGIIFSSLPEQEQTKIAQMIGYTNSQITDLITVKDRDETLQQNINLDEKKELKEILETLLGNPASFEILRLAWLKRFFTSNHQRYSSGYGSSLTPANYVPTHGLVLSPQTDVAISPHADFPTQATILSPRVKPKDFIGLFVSKRKQSMYIAGEEAIDLDDSGLKPDQKLPIQTQLEQAIFRMPNQPIEYLFEYYARPFLVFLEEQGFERAKLETYFQHFSSILNAEKKVHRTSPGDNRMTRRKILLERAIILADKLRTELTEDTYKELETFAKKFIEEKSPVKDGETLWTGFTRLAERHQLPIYNLDGELLWPKKMTHEQVAQFVAQKTEADK